MQTYRSYRTKTPIESLENRQFFSTAMHAIAYPSASPLTTESASAAVSVTQLSPTIYQYSITLKDNTPSPTTPAKQIGTFWYAWIPGEDFLDTAPLSVTSPAGWTDRITHAGETDGYAIQWVAGASRINPGKSLKGFTFTSTDSPATVFGKSSFYPSTDVNTSTVYSGAPFSDAGFQLDAAGSISNPTGALLPQLQTTTPLVTSTVPASGDENPYGVAFVPTGFAPGGTTSAGDVLVSNFNDSANLQGTGTSVISVTPAGAASVFYQGPAGEGLTTALGVLRSGFVLVGNVPTTDGTSATLGQGSLIVLDRFGKQVADFTNSSLLNGPWDLAMVDAGSSATVFVSNVQSGTITRLNLKVSAKTDSVSITRQTQIASGFAHAPNTAALVVGPTGLVFDAAKDALFVASTGDNAIYAIPDALKRKTDAGTGALIYSDSTVLRGPLGLVLAPNGDLITSNGDAINANPAQPSELVEFTPKGKFVAETPVNTTGEGGAFGIAISAARGNTIRFAAVDDLTNSLDVWSLNLSLLRKR
jgi:hypothetical protein